MRPKWHVLDRLSQIGYQPVRNILMLTMYYMLIHLIPDTGPFRDIMRETSHSEISLVNVCARVCVCACVCCASCAVLVVLC